MTKRNKLLKYTLLTLSDTFYHGGKMSNKSDTQPNNNLNTKQTQPNPTRKRSISYPRYSLKDAEKLAWAAYEMGPRNCDQDKVAQKIGYTNALNGAFVALKATTSQFGLISHSGGYLSVTEEWIEAFHTENTDRLKQARQESIRQPDLYKLIFEQYSGKQLPNVEKLARELHINQKYGILKEAATTAAQIFVESANYAGMLDSRGYLQSNIKNEIDQQGEIPHSEVPNANLTENFRTNQKPLNLNYEDQAFPSILKSGVMPTMFPDLDRIEVQLSSGKKAYLFVPVPLPVKEKSRLKKYIDLILEPEELSTNMQQQETDYSSVDQDD